VSCYIVLSHTYIKEILEPNYPTANILQILIIAYHAEKYILNEDERRVLCGPESSVLQFVKLYKIK
jgi:hypothetical protein